MTGLENFAAVKTYPHTFKDVRHKANSLKHMLLKRIALTCILEPRSFITFSANFSSINFFDDYLSVKFNTCTVKMLPKIPLTFPSTHSTSSVAACSEGKGFVNITQYCGINSISCTA